jgi:hypothetical protein
MIFGIACSLYMGIRIKKKVDEINQRADEY